MAEIETLGSHVVYENKWMTVREHRIRRQSGAEGIYGVVEKPNFVVILPIDGDRIHLVQQYRYTVGKRCWELPQGAWESHPNIAPEQLALAELREETGLIAGRMQHVGEQHLAYGFCIQDYNIFIARDFHHGERELDAEEEGLVSQWFAIAEFERMILAGEIKDAISVNAYGLSKLKGFL